MSRLFGSAREPAKLEISDIGVTPELRQQTVQVFALVGEAIAGATHALLANDRELAKRIVDQDVIIDELVDTMVNAAQTRLLEEPSLGVASRRMLMSLIRILPDIERNGDLAEHIARRAARGLGNEMSPRSRGLVERMGEVAAMIWREATDIIIDGKLDSLGAIEDIDDELDDLHVSLTAELTSGSMALPVAVELALLARFYERFGDHCVNLARRQIGRDGGD